MLLKYALFQIHDEIPLISEHYGGVLRKANLCKNLIFSTKYTAVKPTIV